jgi:hypothetical protein
VLRSTARRELAIVLAILLGGGGALFVVLQLASSGWFALHVVVANANEWQAALARGFWRQQLQLRWPLFLAAAMVCVFGLLPSNRRAGRPLVLPALYTLFAAIGALGVGKVGAYSNYFLELYAGLIWLVGAGIVTVCRVQDSAFKSFSVASEDTGAGDKNLSYQISAANCVSPLSVGLLIGSLLYYPPLWNSTELRPAGVTTPSAPRLAFGNYGLHRDLARQDEVLAALQRVQGALASEVRGSTTPLFTDLPGVAASNDVSARLQAFEYRQLIEQGQANQASLLADLANGALDLAVLDYLGNWLTPEMVAVLRHRYAHDGSFGTFKLYRPIALGERSEQNLPLDDAISVVGSALALPSGDSYEGGELLPVALDLTADCRQLSASCEGNTELQFALVDASDRVLTDTIQPLLYNSFAPRDWPRGKSVQQLAVFRLPEDLLPGSYDLRVALNDGSAQRFATITVRPQGGRFFPETGYFVPGTIRRTWSESGGIVRAGLPLSPAVPFAWGTLQCFERVCLELRAGEISQRPLGDLLYLAETRRSTMCLPAAEPSQATFRSSRIPAALCDDFVPYWRDIAETAGDPISGSTEREQVRVQWTQYARLERHSDGSFSLGRLGDETLRLAPGERYPWP